MAAEQHDATAGAPGATAPGGSRPGGGAMFRVMLTGVQREIETPDSFAIKFSILAKAPLSKVKQIVRSLPVALWTGKSRAKAERIIALVEEAGGKGSIVEASVPAATSTPEAAAIAASFCRYCGFPLKENDTRCEFCLTPIAEHAVERPRRLTLHRSAGIQPRRLAFYICVIAVGILILLLRR